MEAAGATEAWTGNLADQHILGGTIMGTSAADSVTDRFGQSHEIPNPFVAGPGLFPTTGAVNPTFTVSALALRTADHLIDRWGGIV